MQLIFKNNESTTTCIFNATLLLQFKFLSLTNRFVPTEKSCG